MGLFQDLGLASGPDFQTMSTLDPDQQQVSTASAQAILGGLGQGQFQGQLSAGLDPGLASIQRWLQTQATQVGRFDTATAGAIQRGLSGQPSTAISPDATLEAWRKGLYEPGLRALQQDAIPLLKDTFAQQGAAFSSRLLDAGRRLTSDFTSGATSALANMLREDRIRSEGFQESAANRAIQTIPLAQQAGVAGVGESSALLQALMPFQGLNQDALDRLRQQFNTINPWLSSGIAFTGLQNQAIFDAQPQFNVEGQALMDLLGAGATFATARWGGAS